MDRLLITHARMVTAEGIRSGHILIEGPYIKELFFADEPPTLPDKVPCLSAEGCYVLPGLVDDQVHFREPGATHKGDMASESRAALLGGVTTWMDMPNNTPPAVSAEALRWKIQRARETAVGNGLFYLGADNTNLSEIVAAHPSLCCGIKVFMGSSTGNMLVDKPEALEALFARTPLPLACHSEDEATIQANLARYRAQVPEAELSAAYHPLIRDHEACLACTRKALDLALRHQSPLHLLHVSTAQELELIARAKEKNPRITVEVCVHHLWFCDADYPRLGNRLKCNPAVKTAVDREALRRAVRQGLIDCIGTDHAPHTREEKALPYLQAPSGLPLIQHSLLMLWELCNTSCFRLQDLVRCACTRPAEIFGLTKRGRIAPGCYADLVLLRPHTFHTVTSQDLAYACLWSPLEGQTFSARIDKVFFEGQLAVDEGKLTSGFAARSL